jgi:mannose-6-phosphate isomerase-like protein (cupin superfamily)
VDGDAEAIVSDETKRVEEDDVIYVPAGVSHNIKNIGSEDLKLYTIYAPPHHAEGTIHATKQEAEAAEIEEDTGI